MTRGQLVARRRASLLHPYNSPIHGAQGGLRHCACSADMRVLAVRSVVIYTIFEGTSEIQRLVIARTISGLQIP